MCPGSPMLSDGCSHPFTVIYQCQNVEILNIESCPCARQNGVWRFEGILNLYTSGVSDQVHVPAALHTGNAPVVTESVRTYRRRKKPVTYAGNQTPIPRLSRRHTDYAILARAVKLKIIPWMNKYYLFLENYSFLSRGIMVKT